MNDVRCLLYGLLLSVSGCMATGQPFSAVQSGFPSLREEAGRIYFYRSTGSVYGVAQHSKILIDGAMVGRSIPGGVFYVDVPEGKHTISLPTLGVAKENTLSVRIMGGETVFIKTWVGASGLAGRTNIEVAEPEDARPVIKTLTFTGGAKEEPTE
ncbi:MAG TPA: hypothetical protein VH374_12055 [Polyangia bacterium]|jgi:hypothetical protein|nr:hypothetical protein [Polyangia bacterium]